MQTKSKAFTLVELLVAMAIIGIILGLALFGISAAQRNARDTQRRAAIQDINAGIADLYTVASSPVNSIRFVAGYALVKRQGDGSVDKGQCDTNAGCVAVPLEGAAIASSTPASDITNGSTADVTNASTMTKYFFSSTATDGYHLIACLENGEAFDGSTASAAASFTCP